MVGGQQSYLMCVHYNVCGAELFLPLCVSGNKYAMSYELPFLQAKGKCSLQRIRYPLLEGSVLLPLCVLTCVCGDLFDTLCTVPVKCVCTNTLPHLQR